MIKLHMNCLSGEQEQVYHVVYDCGVNSHDAFFYVQLWCFWNCRSTKQCMQQISTTSIVRTNITMSCIILCKQLTCQHDTQTLITINPATNSHQNSKLADSTLSLYIGLTCDTCVGCEERAGSTVGEYNVVCRVHHAVCIKPLK